VLKLSGPEREYSGFSELVADAAQCQQVLGRARVALEFFAQMAHVHLELVDVTFE